jgi:formylglycine-generating enzyme
MKAKFQFLIVLLALLAGVHQAAAQGAAFFRVVGPAAATITAFQMEGTRVWIVWSNTQPGTYTIQTISSLPGGTNWVDYVQTLNTNYIVEVTNLLVDFNPPAGMNLIPAGSFTMGDTLDGEPDAIPTVTVTVSAFYMDVNLVSYSQWESVLSWATNNGYGFDNAGSAKDSAANQPVQTVDWYDVVKWSNARSQQAGLTPVYYTDTNLTQVYTNGDVDISNLNVNWTANGYRLPTEAEWEKAARGGLSGQRFPWGDTISETQADYLGDTNDYSYDLGPNGYNYIGGGPPDASSPVGSFAANGYGLYDMAGNVLEFCWDWYGTAENGNDDYGEPTTTNPTGPTSGSNRVCRGGWGGYFAYFLRCACRRNIPPAYAYVNFGFRCVRGL